MNSDRTYCTRKGCLTRTCSRHWKHLPVWFKNPINWEDFEDCDMYSGFDKIPIHNPKVSEEEEDIFK